MDTEAKVDGVLVIRPLREPELECIDALSAILIKVVTSIVILQPNAEVLRFTGKRALQWF